MDIKKLTEILLSSEEQIELQHSLNLLEDNKYEDFYEMNRAIVYNMLFLESLDEFLDFSQEDGLEAECFCFGFLCEKKYGFGVGGYEDDLQPILKTFLEYKNLVDPSIWAIIGEGKVYTDYNDQDNFLETMAAIDQVLDLQDLGLAVFEDCIYCECEYTVLLVPKNVSLNLANSWESENFELQLPRR